MRKNGAIWKELHGKKNGHHKVNPTRVKEENRWVHNNRTKISQIKKINKGEKIYD